MNKLWFQRAAHKQATCCISRAPWKGLMVKTSHGGNVQVQDWPKWMRQVLICFGHLWQTAVYLPKSLIAWDAKFCMVDFTNYELSAQLDAGTKASLAGSLTWHNDAEDMPTVSPGDGATAKLPGWTSQPGPGKGRGGLLSMKLHAVGDSSPPNNLAKARGTSASRS